jgi:hypothetical protein
LRCAGVIFGEQLEHHVACRLLKALGCDTFGEPVVMLGIILIVVLVLLLLGGVSGRFGGYGYGYGNGGIGIVGALLIVLVVLVLMGRL